MEEQRNKILDEIYATEKSYVESMGLCIEYFYKELNGDKNPTQMTKEEVQDLFQHYDQILNINKGFKETLDRLKKENKLGLEIGKTFNTFIPFFKVYIPFVSHYDKVNVIMNKYEKDDSFYEAMLKIMNKIPTDVPLDLRSYLIMPVQRLPRYELLLKDLLRHTEESHPDYQNLQMAYEKIRQTTMMVNERSKEFEQRNNVLKVKELINGLNDFELIQPDRSLIMEGELIKVCKKANKPRYFYLFNDLIVYGIGFEKITVSEYFFLKTVKLNYDNRYEHSFQIINDTKSFSVICPDEKTKEKWMTAISKHVEIQRKISNTKEENSRPVWIQDTPNCLICQKQFTTLNRRHHCRKCGKCICGDCSKGKMVLKEGEAAERVCCYCYDPTGQTVKLRHTMRKMPSVDNPEEFFKTLKSPAEQKMEKRTRQRKKSQGVEPPERNDRKTFDELMCVSSPNILEQKETPVSPAPIVFDFVNDTDIHLASSFDKSFPTEVKTSKPKEKTDVKKVTLGEITSTKTSKEKEKKDKSHGETKLNLEMLSDDNNHDQLKDSKKSRSKSGSSSPRSRSHHSKRKQTLDIATQQEKIQPKETLTINIEPTVTSPAPTTTAPTSKRQKKTLSMPMHGKPNDKQLSIQTKIEEKKKQAMTPEQKKEAVLDGLTTLVNGYVESKSPKAVSPCIAEKEQPTQAFNTSFEETFDFSKASMETQSTPATTTATTATKTRKRSHKLRTNTTASEMSSPVINSSPSLGSERNSIPNTFDFNTETNLFNSPDVTPSSETKSPQPVTLWGSSVEEPSQPTPSSNTITMIDCGVVSSQQRMQPQNLAPSQRPLSLSITSVSDIPNTTVMPETFDFTKNDFNTIDMTSKPNETPIQPIEQPSQQQNQEHNSHHEKEQPKQENTPTYQSHHQPTETKETKEKPKRRRRLTSRDRTPSREEKSEQQEDLKKLDVFFQEHQSQQPEQTLVDSTLKVKSPRRHSRSRSRGSSKERKHNQSEESKKMEITIDKPEPTKQAKPSKIRPPKSPSPSFCSKTLPPQRTRHTHQPDEKKQPSSLFQQNVDPRRLSLTKRERIDLIQGKGSPRKEDQEEQKSSGLKRESQVMRNRRLFEEKSRQQKEELMRDSLLRLRFGDKK